MSKPYYEIELQGHFLFLYVALDEAVRVANAANHPVFFVFNEKKYTVNPGDSAARILDDYYHDTISQYFNRKEDGDE